MCDIRAINLCHSTKKMIIDPNFQFSFLSKSNPITHFLSYKIVYNYQKKKKRSKCFHIKKLSKPRHLKKKKNENA